MKRSEDTEDNSYGRYSDVLYEDAYNSQNK